MTTRPSSLDSDPVAWCARNRAAHARVRKFECGRVGAGIAAFVRNPATTSAMTITKQAPKTKTTRQAPSLGGTARRSPSNDLRAAANPNCFLRRAVAQSLTEHRKRSSELHTAAKAAAVRMLEDAAGQLKTKIGRVKVRDARAGYAAAQHASRCDSRRALHATCHARNARRHLSPSMTWRASWTRRSPPRSRWR